LPAVRISHLAGAERPRDDFSMEDRDLQTVMRVLFDIRSNTIEILELLREDEDEEEAEEEP
jgi:hypothetical protein